MLGGNIMKKRIAIYEGTIVNDEYARYDERQLKIDCDCIVDIINDFINKKVKITIEELES
jgi:hypothetical protein